MVLVFYMSSYVALLFVKLQENLWNHFRIYNKNSAEGVIAPAGAKVTGATIRMWLLNKFISFLAVLTWKTGLKKMKTKCLVGHIYSGPVPFSLMAISSALTFRIIHDTAQ